MRFMRSCLQLAVLASFSEVVEASSVFPVYFEESSNGVGSDVGSYAAPACADMDGDGDIDCLVGNSDGLVQYFENTASQPNSVSFTRQFTNFFSTDVGSYAVPFCMDFDSDGKMDCLVGESGGLVSHFRRDAYQWTRVTSNFFGYDVGSYSAVFCADMDDDGLVDCLVGENGGTIFFFKRNADNSLSFTRQSQKFFGQLDFGTRATPACADLDRDGVLECLVGNSDGYVSYLRKASDGTWVRESDNFFNRDFGSYAKPFCIDLTGDGLVDCLVGESGGLVRLMHQSGNLGFTYEGTLLSDVGSYSVPMCVDMDSDGDLDCLVGDDTGYVEYFRNDGSSPAISFSRTSTNYFSYDSGSYAAPSCFDTDGDGDIDCLVGTSNGNVHHFRKGSSSWTHVSSNFFPFDVGSYAVPFCMDFDNDGDVDCIVGNSDGKVWHFEKSSSFERVSTDFFGVDVGSYAAPVCLDLDRDGKLDCLVGENSGFVHHFRNDGTAANPNWVRTSTNFFARDFGTRAAPFCADVDGDGSVDCLVGHSSGTLYHMRQRAAAGPIFTKEVSRLFSDVGTYSVPFCADMDDDGKIDCLVGDKDGYVEYFRNSGTLATVSLSLSSSNFFNSDVGSYAAPFCFDEDNDGDKDCLVGRDNGYVYLFRNDRFSWSRVNTNYFSRDVGSNAAPFCVDMDADGDLDCLVGNSDGKVYYFRRSASAWTYVSSNFFGYDVGSYAVPFCADLDNDGDVDCLVGTSDGTTMHFRNTGTATSPSWVLATRNYFQSDVGSRAAPFCWDLDLDGDLDCFVGESNGNVYTYKNHQRMAVANASTAATTTTGPAIGSRPCLDGSYLDSGACVQCSAGRYDVRNSSYADTCAECPQCTHSDAGSTSCLQLSVCWLSALSGSNVQLSALHNGRGVLNLRLTMPALPAPSQLHGNMALAYKIDVHAPGVAADPRCGDLWDNRATTMEVALLYDQLDGPCSLNTTVEADDFRRSGFVVLSVIATNDGNRSVRTLSFPVDIVFPRQVVNAYSMSAMLPVAMPWHQYHMDPFTSSLGVFRDGSFSSPVLVPIFEEGEQIFVQQSAEMGQSLRLALHWVWTSKSSDPSDLSRVESNLTNRVMEVTQVNISTVRFSFPAATCQDCVLHVVSKIEAARARRLAAGVSSFAKFAHTSVVLQILPRPSSPMTALKGSLDLSVSDPEAFVSDVRAQQGVADGLSQLLQLPAEARVSVGLTVVASRRRLQAAGSAATMVRAAYTIVMPSAGSGGHDPSSIQTALQSVSPAVLNQAVRNAVSVSTNGAHTVTVTARNLPTMQTWSALATTESEPALVAPDDDQKMMLYIVVGAGAGMVFLFLIGVCCLLRRCRRRPAPKAPVPSPARPVTPAVPPLPAGPSTGAGSMRSSAGSDDEDAAVLDAVRMMEELDLELDAPWTVAKITDGDVLCCLAELFTPPEHTRMTMGIGRDVTERSKKYTKLTLKGAWEVKMPLQKQYYDAKRMEVRRQLQRIDQASPPGVKRTAPTPTLTDKVGEKLGMNARLNEKLLLHGTKVKNIEVILNSGIDERYTTVSIFGNGAYLAEDPSKADQYVEMDSGTATDDETARLHKALYEAFGDVHPGEVFYAFVCQVYLGCPVYTKGPAAPGHPISVVGPTPSCVAGERVFVNEGRRQLISVPGTTPQVPYHSLIVEIGEAVKRHREFVLFDGKAVLPKYLVAYARE